jgi:hypothetical protein
LVLIPVACCALVPLAVAGIAAAGAGFIGGASAASLVFAAGVGLIVVVRRRRQRDTATMPNAAAHLQLTPGITNVKHES